MEAATVTVAVVPSTIEAELAVGLLRANGLQAAFLADDAGGLEPQWQQTQGVQVVVAPADEAAARQILAEVAATADTEPDAS
jgi:hypothetical protein